MDFVGPFPITPRGNRYILVATDVFTKYVEIWAVPNQTAEVCASIILNDVIARWGAPLTIHTNQGAAFESRMFGKLCQMLSVKKTRSRARHPQGNGQVERFNRTLLRMVRAYLVDQQDDWDMYLGCLAGAYRATPHRSTAMTPNMLALGREVRLPQDMVFPTTSGLSEDMPSPGSYVDKLQERMHLAHRIAREHLQKVMRYSKGIYDLNVQQFNYKAGDAVWCLHETKKVGVNPKLERAFDGPFLIKKRVTELNFVLQLDSKGQERLVHHNKLKPYRGNQLPAWILRAQKRL